MTLTQERAITLALNVLSVGFFECPRHYYEYFISNDDWALLMAGAGLNAVGAAPQQVALVVLANATGREGLFEGMTDFRAPRHFCSFLREQVQRGQRDMQIDPCEEGQRTCPYATFEHLRNSSRLDAPRKPRTTANGPTAPYGLLGRPEAHKAQ